jgi:hypothetical protein
MTITQLPSDVTTPDGRWLTCVYRQKKVGGAAVFLENSPAGAPDYHRFFVIMIDVDAIDLRETLGRVVAVLQNCDAAVLIAGQAP